MANIDDFHKWLIRRGRNKLTADGYASDVRIALEECSTPVQRLLSTDLAPKSRRRNLAALRAWAKFTKDEELIEILNDLKLPPADRLTPKIPLKEAIWKKLINKIEESNEPDAIKACLYIIAVRGPRISDVLRLKRKEVEEAIRTGVLSFQAKGAKRLEYGTKNFKWALETLVELKRPWRQVYEAVTAKGTMISASQRLRRALRRIAEPLGLSEKDIYPHKLRRTVATQFLNKVKDVTKLQKFMGWSSVQTASSYVDHDEREELEKVGDSLLD